jgi:hypothetical protein
MKQIQKFIIRACRKVRTWVCGPRTGSPPDSLPGDRRPRRRPLASSHLVVEVRPLAAALEITGPGLKNASTPNISPGQSVKLTVTFRSGAKYDIFCPVPGHKMLGMNTNVKVSGAAVTTSSKANKEASLRIP